MCALGYEVQNHEEAICVIGIVPFHFPCNPKSEFPVKA